MDNTVYFDQFLQTAFENGQYATDDVLYFLLPLFREVLSFHEEGKVAPFDREKALFITNGRLDIDEALAHAPSKAKARIEELYGKGRSGYFNVVGHLEMDTDVEDGTQTVKDRHIHLNPSEPLTAPAYLPGYNSFESLLGHHDDQTDIFSLGLILGSLSLGLDLNDKDDLELFVKQRGNPSYYNNRIHPTLGTLITQMTELHRSRRSQDLYEVIQRMENYCDFDPEKEMDLSRVAGWKNQEISSKGQFILGKLRNRLFDTSRRNRLLYYKPNARFVNLTVSSVPMVLHYQSIRPEWIFTWNNEISEKVRGMKEIVLNKYLRFDDHTYLGPALDKIRSEAQHDKNEYGFSQLRMVIAFLSWHNLKEEVNERIQSPLLLIPVELKKNRKLKEDHYVMKVLANEAEVNPIVASQLRDLYGIRLPDFIDLDDTTLEAFFHQLKGQIDAANQGVTLNYLDKPRIRLIHSVARQTIGNYKKRLRRSNKGLESYKDIAYSYQHENYKPLGLEIFRQRIEPRASFLEFLVNEDINIAKHHLTGTTERSLYQMAEGENNPYSWDFDVCNMVLGNFNYRKMSLVRDYNQVIDGNLHHPVFEHLFSDQPRKYEEEKTNFNNPESWHHVITADPTQTKAILQARGGGSYIIQGPPGTGKSQTITNLIADFMAQGKSVLFVCEKRAALDVVYHRLKQQGLDELCCYIHDSQADKREFIKNLKATYEDFIRNRMDGRKIGEERARLLQDIDKQLETLKDYHFTNARPNEAAGMEVRRLVERLIELKEKLVPLAAPQQELLPQYRDWKSFGGVVQQLDSVLEENGGDPWFAGHPFSSLNESIFLSDVPAGLLLGMTGEAMALLNEMEGVYKTYGIGGTEWTTAAGVKAFCEDATLLYPLAETSNLSLVKPDNAEAKAFESSYRSIKELQKELKEAEEKNRGWKEKFSADDVEAAIALAEAQEGSFFSFFNGSWRKLKKDLNAAYDFSLHPVRPKYSVILLRLQSEYRLSARLNEMTRQLERDYRLQNLDITHAILERLRTKLDYGEAYYLLNHPEKAALVKRLYQLSPSLRRLEVVLAELFHSDKMQKQFTELKDELESIGANIDSLPDLLPALRQLATVSAQMKKAVQSLPLDAASFEAGMADKTLKSIYRSDRMFESCDGPALEDAAAKIRRAYQGLLKLNAASIRALVRNRFLDHLELSSMAASQLNAEQRAFKKSYSEGRKVLEHEFGKSMRYKSIRELAGKESGMVLKDLKPVWLMSPLSVSDSLPIDARYFDVVIFDEASQITLEEGIPSLYRAPQTIIVGDDKQMPPTNFFSAKAEDPDDLLDFDETDEDGLLSHDADSLLVQGSRKLPGVMLGWHYRSRYETLISYSNHAFYEAGLLTIPDRTIHHTEKTPIEVLSAAEAEHNVSTLFDRSISYHFLPNGVYEKRSNAAEAAYIAHLVAELLKKGCKESIGIVAFSQEQQHAIEDALSALATADPVFEQLLEDAYARTENDQYIGLIVKNLENIQGDERDIIIMSVCYGPDARKRMIMNFGPVNRKGGEKRLNVIFSRAKKHMAVVSSIKHTDITNEYNEGASYFRRFLHYAESVSTGNMQLARTILDSLVLKKESGALPRRSVVLAQLKAALQKEGYEVDEQVGQSGFKCSLAIREAGGSGNYGLGILLDDERHYASENLIEQYYQRPAILKDFGWRTISVFARDWLQQPAKVLEQIKKRLTETPIQDEPLESFEVTQTVSTSSQPGAGGQDTPAGLYDGLSFSRLQLSEGSSHKFWEAARDGQKLVIRFGRIGAKGQTQVRSFDSAEQAESEKEKMIREKTGKGYVSAG